MPALEVPCIMVSGYWVLTFQSRNGLGIMNRLHKMEKSRVLHLNLLS